MTCFPPLWSLYSLLRGGIGGGGILSLSEVLWSPLLTLAISISEKRSRDDLGNVLTGEFGNVCGLLFGLLGLCEVKEQENSDINTPLGLQPTRPT